MCSWRSIQRRPAATEQHRRGPYRRLRDGKVSTGTGSRIATIGTDVACSPRAARGHWGIENELHWSPDVAFREDDCRVRNPSVRENLAVLRLL